LCALTAPVHPFDTPRARAYRYGNKNNIRETRMSQPQNVRPLSPHLSVYRWQITNTLSILHRLTGFGLALGLFPFTAWLWGAAYNPDLFNWMHHAFATIPGEICLFGWTLAFYYHLANGMRHLNWDTGRGLEIHEATDSGRVVVAFALAMTVLTWAIVARKAGLV
jgi:succinate dehydrogenase / fumarate reductase cytochrome b subunit